MAIQNFLSGGFYGKLGDVVGQRWRNKRTIRAHVIPHNPRTPAQQSNRALFALATRLAQQAYNVNKGHFSWHDPDSPEFGRRVSTAKLRLQRGLSEAEALPLYPDGFIPDVVLSDGLPDFSRWYTYYGVTENTHIFTDTRSFIVTIRCKDEFTNELVTLSDQVTISAGSTFSYMSKYNARYSFPSGSSIQASTNDDHLFSGSAVHLLPVQMLQPSLPYASASLIFVDITEDTEANQLVFNFTTEGFLRPLVYSYTIYYHDTRYGILYPGAGNMQSFTDGTATIRMNLATYMTFPSGSYIQAGTAHQNTETAIITLSLSRLNFTYP